VLARLARALIVLVCWGVLTAVTLWAGFSVRAPTPSHAGHVWWITLALELLCALALLLPRHVSAVRRWSAAYLMFAGVTYMLAGLAGLGPNLELIEAAVWDVLISPYLLISYVVQVHQHYPYLLSSTPFHVVPEGPHTRFSAAVLVAGLSGILAAYAIALSYRLGYAIWYCLLAITLVSLSGYVLVARVNPGYHPLAVPLCWEASYILALALTHIRSAKNPGSQ